MNKYKKIINGLIKESFPILRKKKIYISFFFISEKYSGGAFWILPFWRVLFINKKRQFTKKQLTGLLAHELGHFELFQKRGWFISLFAGIKYWTSSKFRKKEEDNVNKLIIKKGYAKGYYNLTKKFHNPKVKSFKYYLSSEEIKQYTIKIKKWQPY